MTVNERLEDISRISGFSVEIVRKVLNAEQESILKSLKKGERATLIGRCTLEPVIRQKIVPGREGPVNYIKVRAAVSSIIKDNLENMEGFEREEGNDRIEDILVNKPGVATVQIPSLI